MTFNTRANMIFSAEDRASAVMRNISGGVDNLERSFLGLQAPFLRMQGLLAAFTGGAAVVAIRNLIGAIDDLDEAAQGLGTTAVQLAGFRQAGAEAGVGADQLDKALTKLNVTISEAAAGNEKAKATFKAFNSEALNLAVATGDSGTVLRALADEFTKLQDGPAKAALAVDLFGEKIGARMIPLLNGGSAALERYTGLTDQAVLESRRLQTQIDQLSASFDRLKFTVAGGVVPELNNVIDIIGRINFNRVLLPLLGGNLPAAIAQLAAQTAIQAARQHQLNAALDASVGAYSNEGRAVLSSAQSIRDRAKAEEAAAEASKKRLATLQKIAEQERKDASMRDLARLRRQQDAEQADEEALRAQQRGDSQRDLERLRLLDERANAAEEKLARTRETIAQLTGQADEERKRSLTEQLELMIKIGEVSEEQALVAVKAIAGISDEADRSTEVVEQLGLTLSSSLGELITSGGRASDVFKALGQDVAKLVTQMLILRPLAEELKKLFGEFGAGKTGGSSGGLLGSLIQILGGIFAGGGGGGGEAMGTGAAPGEAVNSFTGGGARPTVNVAVNAGLDRAAVSQMVELGVRAGLARAFDGQQRGGLGFA